MRAFCYVSFVIGSVFMGCSAASSSDVKVIYGDDDRKDIFESTPLMQQVARSTAAQFDPYYIADNGNGTSKIQTTQYGKTFELCKTEPFFNQPTGAKCSAFLVAPDVMATAGHCVKDLSDCRSAWFVFGFGYTDAKGDPTVVPTNEIYKCKAVIKQVADGKTDFALLRLDRPVVGREPLKLRSEGEVQLGDALTLIGHPSGIPTKIAGNGIVRKISDKEFFSAGTDSYGGNSGSAVVNSVGEVEGILVRGERDFVPGPTGCLVSKKCAPDDCRGEDATRAVQFKDFIPK